VTPSHLGANSSAERETSRSANDRWIKYMLAMRRRQQIFEKITAHRSAWNLKVDKDLPDKGKS
jgi:hypothetical protein